MRPGGEAALRRGSVRNAQALVMTPERATKSQNNNTEVTKQSDINQIRVWDNRWRTESK